MILLRIGDRVKIKSLDWYKLELSKCKYKYYNYMMMDAGVIYFDSTEVLFANEMIEFCDKYATIIEYVKDKHDRIIGYHLMIDNRINDYTWTNEMLFTISDIRNMKLKEIAINQLD